MRNRVSFRGFALDSRRKTKNAGMWALHLQSLALGSLCQNRRFQRRNLASAGVVAIVPTSAKFQATIKKEKVSVQRHQIPLAPAQVKTIHSMQGSTADPGLIAHWNLPPQLGEASTWLSRYVLLSRVRSLQCLLSLSLPNRKQFESGPPDDLRQRLHEMFHSKIQATHQAAKEARQMLGWPERT